MSNLYRRISIGKAALVALVASAAILGYACGGGGDDATSSATAAGDGTTVSATSGGGDNTNGSVTATAAATSTSGADLKPAKGKVTYTYNDTKADGTPSSGTFTVYTDPPNVREDGTSSDGAFIFIETPDAMYSCSGPGSADQVCYSSPDTGNLEGIFLRYRDWDVQAEEEGVSPTESNIAGTDAFCFYATDNGESSGVCLSDDGLLLSLDGTQDDGSKSHWLATSYSTDVSDSDFEPPYPVYTTPAIPTGY